MKVADLNSYLAKLDKNQLATFEKLLASVNKNTIVEFAKRLKNDESGKIGKVFFGAIQQNNVNGAKEYLDSLKVVVPTKENKNLTSIDVIENSKNKPYAEVIKYWYTKVAPILGEQSVTAYLRESGLKFYRLDLEDYLLMLPHFNLLDKNNQFVDKLIITKDALGPYITSFDLTESSEKKGELFVERPAQWILINGGMKPKVKGLLSLRKS